MKFKALFLICCLLSCPALGCPTAVLAQGATVNIMVDVLEASEKAGDIDPDLAHLRGRILQSPLKYRSYRNLASTVRTIPIGSKEVITFLLEKKLSIEITPRSVDKRIVSLAVRVWEGKKLILDTDLSLARKGTVIIGAPASREYQALIFAISEGF